MELSISGSGLRPTLNSYMYADALAISKIAELAQDYDTQEEFRGKANRIKKLVQEKLWDDKDAFFKVYPLASAQDSVSKWDFNDIDQMKNVREQIGLYLGISTYQTKGMMQHGHSYLIEMDFTPRLDRPRLNSVIRDSCFIIRMS